MVRQTLRAAAAAGCILLIFSLSYAVGRSGRGVSFEPVSAQTLLLERELPTVPPLAAHGAIPPLAHRHAAHHARAHHPHRDVTSADPAPEARGSAGRESQSRPNPAGTSPSPSGGRTRPNGGRNTGSGGGTHSAPAPTPVPRTTPAPVTTPPDDGGAEAERLENPSDPPPE